MLNWTLVRRPRVRGGFVFAACVLIALTLGPAVVSRFMSNVGLLELSRTLVRYGVFGDAGQNDPNLATAERWLRSATDWDSGNRGAWRGRAFLALAHEQTPEVLAYFRASGLGAANFNAWGDAAALNGVASTAIQWYSLALLVAPEQSDAYALLAAIYEQTSQPAQALDTCLAALDRMRFTSRDLERETWYRAGRLMESHRSALDLMAFYRRAVMAFPGDAYLHAALGRAIYLATEQRPEAELELRRAMQIDPGAVSPYLFLADILLQEKQPDLALLAAGQALDLDPGNAQARVYLGRAYLEQKQTQRALALFEDALAVDPEMSAAHFWIGQVKLLEGHIEQAVYQFRTATELSDGVFGYWYYLGEALRLKGDSDGATRAYLRAQDIDPNSPLPAARLGELAGP